MTFDYAVAVDAGGTSTRCVVFTPGGECVGYARAGSGNPISVGVEQAMTALVEAVITAVNGAGLTQDRIVSLQVAMAGGSIEEPTEVVIARALAPVGFRVPVVMHADTEAAFAAGTCEQDGYLLLSGTGAAALRIEGGECVATADGLGWLLGDIGSGYWIGHRVVEAALADLDRRGPATVLTRLVADELDLDVVLGEVPNADDRRPSLMSWTVSAVYADRPVRLSRFARLAFQAANDPVADSILDDAATGLLASLRAVSRPGLSGPVVVAGGVLSRQPSLLDRISRAAGWQPDEPQVRATADGLAGAVVLGLRNLGVTVDEAIFDAVHASLSRLR